MVLSILGIGAIILLVLVSDFVESLFSRIINTIQSLLQGSDITSSRTLLWDHAWGLFLENPFSGIGWGNFKYSVIGNITVNTAMEPHNIYFQLISETGIFRTILILFPLFLTYFKTFKSVRIISYRSSLIDYKWKIAVLYSFYSQTFFLIYGLTGNPLTDFNFLMMYFISLGLIYSFWLVRRS